MKKLGVFILFISINTLQGQIFEVDSTEAFFKDIYKLYCKKDVLSFNVTMIQKDSIGTNVISSTSGSVDITLGSYKMVFPEISLFVQDSMKVYLNEKSKSIMVQKLKMGDENNFNIFANFGFNDFLKERNIKLKLIKSNETSNTYSLLFNNTDENAYVFTRDKKTGFINYVLIKYYDKDKNSKIVLRTMEIIYSNYKRDKLNKFKPVNEVLKFEDNNIVPTNKYQGYTIN